MPTLFTDAKITILTEEGWAQANPVCYIKDAFITLDLGDGSNRSSGAAPSPRLAPTQGPRSTRA